LNHSIITTVGRAAAIVLTLGYLSLAYLSVQAAAPALKHSPKQSAKQSVEQTSAQSFEHGNPEAAALGTLLYTADERIQLEEQQRLHAAAQRAAQSSRQAQTGRSDSSGRPDSPKSSEATAASGLRVDGYLRPAQGRPVIWINGHADGDRAELANSDDQVIVRLNKLQHQRLAPGQNSESSEFGAGNSVVIHRAP
jgi:hypothetical protein